MMKCPFISKFIEKVTPSYNNLSKFLLLKGIYDMIILQHSAQFKAFKNKKNSCYEKM